MVNINRGRIAIDPAGAWRLYTTTIPAGAEVLGTVAQGAETGALIRYRGTGLYAQLNAGAVRSLDQRKLRAALEGAYRGLIIQHVMDNWYNNVDDRMYNDADAAALYIGPIDADVAPPGAVSVVAGDWEISEGGEYAEWVRIVDGRVISLGDSLGRRAEGDPPA